MSQEDLGLDRMDGSHKGSKKSHRKTKIIQGIDTAKIVLVVFLVLLALVVIVNIYTILNLKQEIQERKTTLEEELRPPLLNLYILKDPNCSECIDLSPLVGSIKSGNVKIQLQKEVLLGSDEAKHLIPTYGLQKIPAIIITGEVNKLPPTSFQKRGDGLVYEPTTPPYTHAVTGEIIGQITAILLNDTTCTVCFDLKQYLLLFQEAGFHITQIRNIDARSEEGETLIRRYTIAKLPGMVLSKDMGAYPNITQIWSQLGTIEDDGAFVLREANPPYRDLDTGKIRGLVDVTYIIDLNCTACYNVLLHKQILSNFGITFGQEKTYDISSNISKQLIAQYNITKVPVLILDQEGGAYPNLVRVWNQVGTIENGNFVFRRVESLGAYHDLITDQIVTPKKEETSTPSG